jgi:hypothetical protein
MLTIGATTRKCPVAALVTGQYTQFKEAYYGNHHHH